MKTFLFCLNEYKTATVHPLHRYNSVDNMANEQHGKKKPQPQSDVEELYDLSDPEAFRKAFIASEILNRKY